MSTAGAAASTGGGSTGAGASTGAAASTGTAQSTGGFTWGETWRNQIAAGSTDAAKELQRLERFNDPAAIYKSFRTIENRIAAGEFRSTLPKGASADELTKWRTENGIPAKPEDYKITMPAGKQPPKEDDAFLKAFLKNAHESNFTQDQVDKAIGSFYAETDRQAQVIDEAEAKATKETDDKLHEKWGKDYRANMNMAEALLARAPAGFADKFKNGYLADHTPIKASVEAWDWLVAMEREINPMPSVVPNLTGDPAKNVDARINELKALMGNATSIYWKGAQAEALQEEYRKLLDAKNKLAAKSGVAQAA